MFCLRPAAPSRPCLQPDPALCLLSVETARSLPAPSGTVVTIARGLTRVHLTAVADPAAANNECCLHPGVAGLLGGRAGGMESWSVAPTVSTGPAQRVDLVWAGAHPEGFELGEADLGFVPATVLPTKSLCARGLTLSMAAVLRRAVMGTLVSDGCVVLCDLMGTMLLFTAAVRGDTGGAMTVTDETEIQVSVGPGPSDAPLRKTDTATGRGQLLKEEWWQHALAGVDGCADSVMGSLRAWYELMSVPGQGGAGLVPRVQVIEGPTGTGKTTLGRLALSALPAGVEGVELSAYDMLGEAFSWDALAPAGTGLRVVLLDGMEALATDDETATSCATRLWAAMQQCGPSVHFVLTVSDREHLRPAALRTAGVPISTMAVPDKSERAAIFQRHLPAASADEAAALAAESFGMVGRDIARVCALAARRPPTLGDGLAAAMEALSVSDPVAAVDEVLRILPAVRKFADHTFRGDAPPAVRWEDAAGYESTKTRLVQAARQSILTGAEGTLLGRPPSGALLYGPTGCGKTLLASTLATHLRVNTVSVRGPALFSKYVGDSEKAVRDLFRQARQLAPCVVVIDEVDSAAPRRGADDGAGGIGTRVLDQLLSEMDGVESTQGVFVVGCTGRKEEVDSALLRPGRLDIHLEVARPSDHDRDRIVAALASRHHLTAAAAARAVSLSAGFSCAEVEGLVREAAVRALRRDIDGRVVEATDVDEALRVARSSVPPAR